MSEKKQLFCVTYAGGTASFFNSLSERLSDELEVCALEYAGHGTRRKEPFYNSIPEMCNDIASQIKQLRNNRLYGIFGYSMGSIVAYEVAANYMQSDRLEHLFLAAHEPPHIPPRGKNYAELSDTEFAKAMVEYGGIPEKMISNKHFFDVYLPPMRVDYNFIQDYSWSSDFIALDADISVFYSESDTRRVDMAEWARYTTGKCTLTEYDGNHFFMKKYTQEIADEIKKTFL